jgi:hypothetical protein
MANLSVPTASLAQRLEKISVTDAKKKTSFLSLPNEIGYQIIGYLDLHDLYITHLTCRWTHALTNRDWKAEIAKLSKKERLDFMYKVAAGLDDVWACRQCVCLHPINTSDVPVNYGIRESKPFCLKEKKHLVLRPYGVTEVHIQLAFKYHGRQNLKDIYAKYLAELLKPYTRTVESGWYSRTLKIDHRVTPKIMNGRFMLESTMTVQDAHENIRLAELSRLTFCPHMNVGVQLGLIGRIGHSYIGPIHDVVPEEAVGGEFRGSCTSCMTEYSVVPHLRQCEGRVWYALGSCQEPDDEEFLSHIRPRYELLNMLNYGTMVRHPTLQQLFYNTDLVIAGRNGQSGTDVEEVRDSRMRPLASLAQLLYPLTFR